MGVIAGPPYNDTAMGQGTSALERESARHRPSIGAIVREDSIHIEEEPSSDVSRPDSWSIHCDRTDQAPYHDGEMTTATSLQGMPKGNELREMAWFLKNTGPSAPHRRPSKAERPRAATAPKKALNFLKLRPRRSKKAIVTAHDRYVSYRPVACVY